MSTPTPLKFLMPGWFSLVMGLGGLSLAWFSGVPLLGPSAGLVASVLAVVAAAVFVALAIASAVRWQRHRQAWEEDLKHPVRHAFVAAIPVSLLILAAVAQALALPPLLVRAIWVVGSIGQLWATVWVLGRWLALSPTQAPPGALWNGVTPVLFIPVVGNVVAPLAGVGLGHGFWSLAHLGIGVVFWPVVLTLTLVRRIGHSPLPERLMPTWFITLAPPSVVGLSLLRLGAPDALAQACWGVGLFALLWAGTQAKRLVQQPFGIPFWALSFPLAAFTGLTLKLADRLALPALQTVGLALLALTSLVIGALVLGTLRGLRQGTLLAPEPIATVHASTP